MSVVFIKIAIFILLFFTVPAAVVCRADFFDDDFGVVLTPARLKQNLADTPASVTVLTGDMLKAQHIMSIPEAMRLVPGMVVLKVSSGNYRISYHGTDGLQPKRMQVLIDGISWYQSGLSLISWKALPIAIEEVERIEVTRSPSTSSYGANSFSAVINIISKHPDDYKDKIFTSATGGSLSTKRAFVRYAGRPGNGNTAVALSFNHQQDEGFDSDGNDVSRRDGIRINQVRLSTITELNKTTSITSNIGFSDTFQQDQYGDDTQISFPDINENTRYAAIKLSYDINPNNRIDAKLYVTNTERKRSWRSCVPAIALSDELRALHDVNPSLSLALLAGQMPTGTQQEMVLINAVLAKRAQLAPNTGGTICGDVNEDVEEIRYDIDVQHTAVLGDHVRAVFGFGGRKDINSSMTFYGGRVTAKSWRFFSNIEYKPWNALVINMGGMYERDNILLDRGEFTPRLAANIHITDEQTIRFIYSEAIRTPDLLDQKRNWSYYATNLQPLFDGQSARTFFATIRSDGRLQPERIKSHEISYYYHSRVNNLTADIKIFREELGSLISERATVREYVRTNNNAATLTGLEFELRKKFMNTEFYLSYAHINNKSTTFFEKTLQVDNLGSFVVKHSLTNTLTLSGAYYGNTALAGTSFNRYDLSIAKMLHVDADINANIVFTLNYYPSTLSNVFRNENEIRSNQYNNNLQMFLTTELKFN